MMDGVFPMFFLGKASKLAQCSNTAQHNPASVATTARRSESGLSGGWGTTGLSVPVLRMNVPSYVSASTT